MIMNYQDRYKFLQNKPLTSISLEDRKCITKFTETDDFFNLRESSVNFDCGYVFVDADKRIVDITITSVTKIIEQVENDDCIVVEQDELDKLNQLILQCGQMQISYDSDMIVRNPRYVGNVVKMTMGNNANVVQEYDEIFIGNENYTILYKNDNDIYIFGDVPETTTIKFKGLSINNPYLVNQLETNLSNTDLKPITNCQIIQSEYEPLYFEGELSELIVEKEYSICPYFKIDDCYVYGEVINITIPKKNISFNNVNVISYGNVYNIYTTIKGINVENYLKSGKQISCVIQGMTPDDSLQFQYYSFNTIYYKFITNKKDYVLRITFKVEDFESEEFLYYIEKTPLTNFENTDDKLKLDKYWFVYEDGEFKYYGEGMKSYVVSNVPNLIVYGLDKTNVNPLKLTKEQISQLESIKNG